MNDRNGIPIARGNRVLISGEVSEVREGASTVVIKTLSGNILVHPLEVEVVPDEPEQVRANPLYLPKAVKIL